MDLTNTLGYVAGFPLVMGIRELGGWRSADGRTVRHGLLYRGSFLANLSDDQKARIDGFGLRFLLDLRASGELEGRADYVPRGAEYLQISGMYDQDGVEVDFSPKGIARISSHMQSDPEAFLNSLYASMAFGNPAVHALVEHLVAHEAPLYFHCTAGKDRTGVCSALLLMLLGVPDDDIVREFLLTNEYRSSIINMPPEELPANTSERNRKNWARINGVDEAQLRHVFRQIDDRYATRDDYFANEFGLCRADVEALRAYYLE